MTPDAADRIAEYVRLNPDADPVEVLGTLGLSPDHREAVEAALAGDRDRADHGDAPGDPVEGVNQQKRPEDRGVLVNGGGSGDTGEPGDSVGETPANGGFSDANPWLDAAVSAPTSGVYPEDLDELEKWMGAGGETGKQAFAPWADRDHLEAAPEKDARWKWGLEQNHAAGDTVDEWLAKDPRLGARAFIQLEADPFAFVDGDDVRCPDTGAVHPAFRALLEHLGATYADVSTSGSGVHAHYRGELPLDGNGQAVFEIDTEPFGANDDPPTVEIYANTHLAITSGEHIPGSPLEVAEWDTDALRAVLEAHGFDDEPEIAHDTDRDRPDLEAHDPEATDADDTADDVRDVLAAVDRLRPGDLPLRTRQVDTDATGWEKWDPSSYRPSSGNNSLHRPPGEPVFHDHKHNESFGVLSLFAAEEGIIREPWDRLAGADWWDAVDAARDAGASIPEHVAPTPSKADAEDVEHTAVLPPAVRELATTSSGWDWQHAAESSPALALEDARDRTRAAIADAYQHGDRRLIRALPTLGKSYGAVAAAADTDTPITVLTGRGRKEQYGQFKEWADEHGLSYKVLPAFTSATRGCPTAAGLHDEDWRATVMGWYDRGATGQEIHNHAEDALGRPLPCQVAENGDRIECRYRHAWEFDPDEYDVLIGHYAHAYVELVTAGRAVVFDEFPEDAYETTLAGDDLETAVSYWLRTTDAVPFDSYHDLVENRDDDRRRADALLYLEDHVDSPDERAVFDNADAHAAAPFVVWTLLAGDDLGNGLEHAELADLGTGVFDHDPDAPDRPSTVRVLQPPALPPSADVVALDGTPTLELWELALGCRLNPRDILQDAERAAYLRDTLNLQVVPTTEYVKPYNSEDHVNTDADAALLEAITDTHDETPGVISSTTALEEYADADVLEYDSENGAVEDGPADRVKWYGNVLGSNDFKQKRVGAVLGSNHFGDGYVKLWGAYAGRAVESPDRSDPADRGHGLSYGSFGDKVHTHMTEHETLQAAMRFGRDGNGAVVYVHTDTLPEWVPTAAEGRVLTTWSDGMRDVVDALEELGTATTAGLADHPAVDLSRRQVFDHLESLRKRGVLDRRRDAEDGRRVVWVADGVHRLNNHGDVELPDADLEDLDADEVQELARSSIYTWEFTNRAAEDVDTDPPTTDATTSPPTGEVIGGDPPPDPGD